MDYILYICFPIFFFFFILTQHLVKNVQFSRAGLINDTKNQTTNKQTTT